MVTYGTNPGMGMAVDAQIPKVEEVPDASASSFAKSLNYMGLQVGQALKGQKIQNVFIGSCTNSRIEDLRLVADFVKGKTKAPHVKAYIIPGSKQVEQQARKEGLHDILTAAGFELREPGCSACLGMNEDKIPAGEYCVSTSNRNFEGRQGPGARTILASPLSAAVAAITGEVTDIREWLN
jgi:3-isopropylmalate/(R)-2-methylmalate dehydratase large subunit